MSSVLVTQSSQSRLCDGPKTDRVGYLNDVLCLNKSLDLLISSWVGYFENINAFLIYSICFHKTVQGKWFLDKTIGQTENGLERGLVKHWLNYV